MRKRNIRKLYEEFHNIKIPKGCELHHIIPHHSGGNNEMSNLIHLTSEEHQNAHLQLYKKFGNFRDLCAYYMIGYNFSEAHRISSSNGGKIGGIIARDKKLGIHTLDKNKKTMWGKKGGVVGGKLQYENNLGFHKYRKENPKKYAEWCSMGGKQAFINDPERHRKMSIRAGCIGGRGNIGFKWYNNGIKAFKYTKKMQENKSFNDFLEENLEFIKGRIKNNENKNN